MSELSHRGDDGTPAGQVGETFRGGETMKAGVLTVSDRVSRGEAEDRSGPLAARLLDPGVYVAMHNRVLAFPGVDKDRAAGTFVKPGPSVESSP